MKKSVSLSGPSITLVVALVMVFVGLAALLLANSLRGQLQEMRRGSPQAFKEEKVCAQTPTSPYQGTTGRKPIVPKF